MAKDMPLACLENELTCGICSEAFKNPVTLHCGHNFCNTCLDDTWKESLILVCPQCRHLYPNRPELKKNTVLSAVVESFNKSSMLESDQTNNVKVCTTETEVVKCDTCMEANAIKTCLTCMASYCEEHVQPHHINPVFRAHQLVEPIRDLQKHICQDHVKFMEFFCQKHNCTACSNCLQFHRDCEYITLREAHSQKESEMKGMLVVLGTKIDMNNTVMTQVREQQLQLQDAATARKRSMREEYDFIRHLIDRSEQEALKDVDKDLGSSQAKIQSLIKKFSKNVDKMTAAKMELNNLLSNANSLAFLQASVKMPPGATTDPQCPCVNMDSKAVVTSLSSAVAVKELLMKILALPAENRIALLQSGVCARVHLCVCPYICTYIIQILKKKKKRGSEVPEMASPVPEMAHDKSERSLPLFLPLYSLYVCSLLSLLSFSHTIQTIHLERQRDWPANRNSKASFQLQTALQLTVNSQLMFLCVCCSAVGRTLKWDPRTAHRHIVLSEDLTKASMSSEPCPYPDGPERFSVCPQVLCSTGFLHGRHYWEVQLSGPRLCGLGLAYGSINRRSPSSRLGLNAKSWCLEWFNDRLSAWHNSVETVLDSPPSKRVGVLLDCDGGSASFYMVTDHAYPWIMFALPHKEAVYPALWIYSAGSSISLCKPTS
ncbi:hypothetical protein ACEWY4_000192 [Coilia grayii]|uniref:Uncharacterized protein n=1 Tax=Coilia grayii TaxID=363190 RepID=A0ABD1KVZ1_9TELE